MKTDMQLRQERDAHRKAARQVSKLLRQRSRKAHGLPSDKPTTWTRDGHEYLESGIEKTRRRVEIFRNAGGEVAWFDPTDPSTIDEIEPATCQGCAEAHLVSWDEGHWHHNVKSKGGRRCDCAKCGKFVCPTIHEIYRNRIIP